MSATDHTKHYSAADIQRYLAGNMSPADMHALELAALDDPFLADAIEGMQQSLAQQENTPIDTDLQELQRRLRERVAGEDRRQAAPVIAFRWWQAAAAAVVVIIGGIWAFNAFQDKAGASKEIAMVRTTEQHAPKSVSPAASDSASTVNTTTTDPPMLKAAESKAEDVRGKASGNVASNNNVIDKADDASLQQTYRPQQTPAPPNAEAKSIKQQDEIAVAEKAHQPAATRSTLNHEPIAQQDSIRMALVKKNLASQRNQATVHSFNSTSRDLEQIVVSKTPRDTSAAGYLSKPRELTMNTSRKELSAKQAKKNPDALLSGFVSGRVTDNATNTPISNAMVRIEGNRDYFTDNKGWFKIPTTDSVVNVAVGTSGYYTQNLQLNYNSNNLITLNQLGNKAPNPSLNVLQGRVAGIQVNQPQVDADSTTLNRIMIRGYGNSVALDSAQLESLKAVSRRSKANPLAKDTEPEYGWVKYQQYLDQNKQIPANGATGAGKVVITFDVDKKGVLSNFKVHESPGQAYSDEAIRLIKAGPSWKLLKGRKATTTVVVTF